MPLLLGLAGLGIVVLLVRLYAEADVKQLKNSLRWTGIFLGLVLVIGLAVTGRLAAALAFLAGLTIWAYRVFGVVQMAHQLGRAFGLFRGQPGAHSDTGAGAQSGGPPPPPGGGGMDEAEALRVLGLKRGASLADIKAAYRRLMAQVHPDKGGSDYFAAKVNAAKDVLLKGKE